MTTRPTWLANTEHQTWARAIADQGITLVKDTVELLPISPETHQRVLLYDLQNGESYFGGGKTPALDIFTRLLTTEGFAVDRFDPSRRMEGHRTLDRGHGQV